MWYSPKSVSNELLERLKLLAPRFLSWKVQIPSGNEKSTAEEGVGGSAKNETNEMRVNIF